MGGIGTFVHADAKVSSSALDKVKPPVSVPRFLGVGRARRAACRRRGAGRRERRYDAECYARLPTGGAVDRRGGLGGCSARPRGARRCRESRDASQRTARLPKRAAGSGRGLGETSGAAIDRATVVPPGAGCAAALSVFLGVRRSDFGAPSTRPRSGRGTSRKPARWATTLLAELLGLFSWPVATRDLEQFNTMDVADDATDLMVPREKKRRREEPVLDGLDAPEYERKAVLQGIKAASEEGTDLELWCAAQAQGIRGVSPRLC